MATFILNPNPPTAASWPVRHRRDPGLRTFQASPTTAGTSRGCFPSVAPGTRPHPAQAIEILKLPALSCSSVFILTPRSGQHAYAHHHSQGQDPENFSLCSNRSVSEHAHGGVLHTRKLVNQPGHFPLPSFQPWTCSSKSSIYMPSYKVQLLPKQRGKSAAFMILQ